MDGKQLLQQLRIALNESSTSGWMDDFTSYMYLWLGAREFVTRTECFKSSQSITTVANTTSYLLNADFLQIFAKTKDNRYFLKLNDGTSDHYMFYKDYNEILYDPTPNAVQYPYNFTIIDESTPLSVVSGTVSSAGASSAGLCTLTDSTASFSTISAGDTVHNLTDLSIGVVVSVTSSTALQTALFGGTNDDWTLADAYQIVPQGRYLLVIDPAPSTTGYTITVPYLQRPFPVFSDYGSYRFQDEYCLAIMMYAAWLYKYQDSKPNEADKYFVHFDNQVKRYAYSIAKRAQDQTRMKVNMKARRR